MKPWLMAGLATVLLTPSDSMGEQDPCKRCAPKKAEWSWKANGYAIAPTSDAATELAKTSATESACKASAKYLDASKLKCAAGCNAGVLENTCGPEKDPACTSGTYESNRGMWTFVCNKYAEGTEPKISCDADQAKVNPGYSSCEVSVKAVRTLPCVHPDCEEGG